MNLFTYGTLTFPEVWKRIAVRECPAQRAVLSNFAIYRVRNAVFPGIIRSEEKDSVEGILYSDVDEETLFELDAYESDFYDRESVWVTTANLERVEAQVYLVPPSHRQMLTHEPWDAAWFAEHELERYLDGT